MAAKAKKWSSLGFATVLVGTTSLVGCGEQAPTDVSGPVMTSTPADTEVVAPPQGGEGEGGVAIEAAAYDPAVYLTALAIAKAHVLAARDAHAAGEIDAASEMFAHPASEVLMDMEPIFKGRGVDLFTDLFLDTSDLVADGADHAKVAAQSDLILATLDEAAKSAPPTDKTDGAIAAAVIADQIDRAADMYKIAKEAESYGPYLDGYGFLEAAKLEFAAHKSAITKTRPDLVPLIEKTLAGIGEAYPGATLPAEMPLPAAAVLAQASQLKLSLS